MLWSILAYVVIVVTALLMGTLLHRKLRQRRTSTALRIGGSRGIMEERFVKIGGIDQWIGIRGEHRNNPILLIIHGGPGSSYSIFTPLIRSWERHFTVVQWDQPGASKTFGRAGRNGSGKLTFDRLTGDGIETAEFVCSRLNKEKVILLASSFGSLTGMSMVKQRPDLFYAYVGTDQNVGMVRNREAIHRATLERLRALGLSEGVAFLERIGSDPTQWTAKSFTKTAKWTMKSDPRTHEQIMQLLKSAICFSPSYTLRDIKHFVSGMKFSTEQLFPEIPASDAWQQGTHFDVPFFIFQGENDVLTPASLAAQYFADVVAPAKKMTLIRDAGHFAAFIQPEQFLHELLVCVRPLMIP
jgi:pimeloyl-ACP methyl ester carboxylesterase